MDILNFISWIKGKKVVTSVNPAKTLLPVALQDDRRDDDYLVGAITVQNFTNQIASTIPAGAQGPQGPQGVSGPVGPAGLNWQGAWSTTGTYVVDDAVGYNGASWFCINPVGPSVVDPQTDIANWALLAAQGAQGPQGPQGVQGPVGTSTPSFSIVPAGGTVTISAGQEIVVSVSVIPGGTFNNTTRPILNIKTAMQKFVSADVFKAKIYITNTTQVQGTTFNPISTIQIALADTATTGSAQRVIKIERDVYFSGGTAVFLNQSSPNIGYSDSAIGGNAGPAHDIGAFDNGMLTGTINWGLDTYFVVTAIPSTSSVTIGGRYLSVSRI